MSSTAADERCGVIITAVDRQTIQHLEKEVHELASAIHISRTIILPLCRTSGNPQRLPSNREQVSVQFC